MRYPSMAGSSGAVEDIDDDHLALTTGGALPEGMTGEILIAVAVIPFG